MIFKDRKQAADLLAEKLAKFKDLENALILGIPRGGVIIASEVSDKLKIPFDVVITRKISSPGQPELAVGAIDTEGEVVWEDKLLKELDLTPDDLKAEAEKEMKEIKRRELLYREGFASLDVTGKIVLLVDDGIATGSTASSAIHFLKNHQPQKIILAVPVTSKEAEGKLSKLVDETVFLQVPENLEAIGYFYKEFHPVSDEEVELLMSGANK